MQENMFFISFYRFEFGSGFAVCSLSSCLRQFLLQPALRLKSLEMTIAGKTLQVQAASRLALSQSV